MADGKTRIYSLPEITNVDSDMYIMLDSGAVGTRKYNLKTMYDKVDGVTDAAEAAQAAATSATTAATQASSAAGAANTAASQAQSTVQTFMADATEQMDGLVDDVDAALDAIGDISELAVPLMSESTRGGAKLGHGLTVEDGALGIGEVTDATDAGPIVELSAKGWAEQDATTGKNLLHHDLYDSLTAKGVTLTKVDSTTQRFVGTTSSTGDIWACPMANYFTTAGTYTFSVTSDDTIPSAFRPQLAVHRASDNAWLRNAQGATGAKSVTFALAEGERVNVLGFIIDSSGVAIDATVHFQIELGSTATSYEPYTGGALSPSPSYPQEIRRCVGRNLLKYPYYTPSGVLNGVTCTVNADGSVTFNGTATNTVYFNFATHLSGGSQEAYDIEAGSYVVSCGVNLPSGVSLVTNRRTDGANYDSATIASGSIQAAFSPTATGILRCYLQIASGTTVSNLRVYPQLEAGSIAHPYVPYGHVGVDVQGRNLLLNKDVGSVLNGITYTVNPDGSVTFNGTATAQSRFYFMPTNADESAMAETLKSATHVLSVGAAATASVRVEVALYNDTTYTGTVYRVNNSNGFTVINPPTVTFNVAKIYILVDNGQTVNNLTFYPMLELGDTAHAYEPYYHTTIPVPLPSRGWVAALPDGTADTLALDGAGGYVWTLACGEVTFDGDEAWDNDAGTVGDNYRHNISTANAGISTITAYNQLSNRFIRTNGNLNNRPFGEFYMTYQWIVFTDQSAVYPSLAEWKSFLASNPVTVLYPLATPTTESGYVTDFPTVPRHASISCPDLTDLAVRCCADEGAAEIAGAWGRRYESRIAALEATVAELVAGV